MLGNGILKNTSFVTPIGSQSTLKPKGSGFKKSLMFTLTLTSLIDAFVILVIYLLVNFSDPAQTKLMQDNLQLPQASHNDVMNEGTVVSLNNGHYFIDQKEVSLAEVTSRLAAIVQSKPEATDSDLIIQADKRTDYDVLSPIIVAGSQAGFHQFKFAVIQGASQGGTK